MSDKLNEKFEEFATEQKVTIVEGDPMPTVSANVIPGTGSEPSQVSDEQTSNGTGKDPRRCWKFQEMPPRQNCLHHQLESLDLIQF